MRIVTADPLLTPGRFAPYEVVGEIARGGQGAVLEARHGSRRVALKVLLDLSCAERFRQEGKLLTRLSHPYLLVVAELAEAVDGTPFFVMERVDGEGLPALLRRGVPRFDWTAQTLARVAHAVHYCHEQGVVHRDLKPSNVLIDRATGRPVVVDFGMAKRDATRLHLSSLDERSQLSASGELKGTPKYMAPEQANPKAFGEVGTWTDVYGLGGILYFLLTGLPPFEGTAVMTVLRKVATRPPPDPREANPEVPAALAELCVRALAKASDDRPESALKFAQALAEAAGLPPLPVVPGQPVGAWAEAETETAPVVGAPRPATHALATGSTIGDYVIESELGRGAMGVVFRVHHRDGDVPLALKLLLSSRDGRRRTRFEREAEIMRFVGRHPNIISLREYGESRGRPYLVMDLHEGGDLRERLDRTNGELDEMRACARILAGAARALHFAHEARVLHRDLKPSNILLGPDDAPIVADFGLAKDEQTVSELTKTGAMVGTLAFMAPEQVAGSKSLDRRTDVYALGGILYEILAGKTPFHGGQLDMAVQVITAAPTPPHELRPNVPLALEAVCLRAMAKEKDERQPSAQEFAHELEAALDGDAPARPILRRGPNRVVRVATAVVAGVVGLGVGLTLRPVPPAATPRRGWAEIVTALAAGTALSDDAFTVADGDPDAARWLPLARAVSHGGRRTRVALQVEAASPARDRLLAEHLLAAGEVQAAWPLLESAQASPDVPWRPARAGTPWVEAAEILVRSDRPDMASRALMRASEGNAPVDVRADWVERAARLSFLTVVESGSKPAAAALAASALETLRRVDPEGDAALPAGLQARRRLFLARLIDRELRLVDALLALRRLAQSQNAKVSWGLRPWAQELEPTELKRIEDLLLAPTAPAEVTGRIVSDYALETNRVGRNRGTWPPGWKLAFETIRTHRLLYPALCEWILWRPELSMLWFEAARDAYQVGDVFVSVRLVEVAAKLEQTGEVWAYKAKCNQHVGRLDEALDASRKALQLDPRHKWRAFTHVGILVSTGTLKNATEAVALADAMSLQHPAQLGKVGRFWWTMARANTIAGNKAAATTCVQTARSITKQ